MLEKDRFTRKFRVSREVPARKNKPKNLALAYFSKSNCLTSLAGVAGAVVTEGNIQKTTTTYVFCVWNHDWNQCFVFAITIYNHV